MCICLEVITYDRQHCTCVQLCNLLLPTLYYYSKCHSWGSGDYARAGGYSRASGDYARAGGYSRASSDYAIGQGVTVGQVVTTVALHYSRALSALQ